HDSEAPAKRYRYTGMERDEESGLSYHAARHYMPWLGRWVSGDPSGLQDGVNLIAYAWSNPMGRVDRGGLNSTREVTQFNSDTLLEEFGALPNVTGDWIDAHRKFSETVESNLSVEPTPTTAREKSVDVDIETEAHDRAVVNIINAAIDAASRLVKSKGIEVSEHDLLKIALQTFVYPYRTGNNLTENLILRDADHFLAGRIQAWRDFAPGGILGSGPTKDPSIIQLGNLAAIEYDNEKRASFMSNPRPDEPHAKSSKDQDSKPASAPGGRFWAWMGGQLLLTRDHPAQLADSSKLKVSYEDVKGARINWPLQKLVLELLYKQAQQFPSRAMQYLEDTVRFVGERMHD
ncbi:MAG: RHS repeat-associated core domain-containing protein, partial [Nitrospira sp.]|nr:RHS repeat-associated core domain-containing protein [Nitrospira sp.]